MIFPVSSRFTFDCVGRVVAISINGSLRDSLRALDFANGVALTTQFTPGNYEVDYLRLQDVAQNQSYFSVSEIDALEEPSIGSINVYFPTESEILGGKSVVEASASDDFVFGSNASDDTLMAGDGDDTVYSGDGDDEVDAGDGDDEVIGGSGEGDDIYRGGLGVDTVIYSSAINPITVDLEAGFAEGADIGLDSLSGFESVVAGRGPMYLEGTVALTYLRAVTELIRCLPHLGPICSMVKPEPVSMPMRARSKVTSM